MADPSFIFYKPPGGESDTDAKAQKLLKLLPDIQDKARRERVMQWLDSNGYGDEMLRAAPSTATVGKQYDLAEQSFTKPTLSEAAGRLAGRYDESTLGRLRSGDLRALDALRPADRADVERSLKSRELAANEPQAHAPMAERPGGLAAELDAAAAERAPVSRSRSGDAKPEYTHTLGERAAATVAQPMSGAVKGLHYSTGRLTELPARAIAPEGQAMLDELASTSRVTAPAAVASSMLPMSLGSRVAGVAARAIPEVAAAPGVMNLGLRALAGAGRAAVGGGAAGAVDAAGAGLNEMQQGMPASELPSMVGQGMVESVPAALAMYPVAAGLQRFGRSAVSDLQQSPTLGPDVLALKAVGGGTRLPLLNREFSLRTVTPDVGAPTLLDEVMDTGRVQPGRIPFTRRPIPPMEGAAIAEARRQQQATGRPAADITAGRAARKAISTLEQNRSDLTSRQGLENDLYYASPQGMDKVSTRPVVDYILERVAGNTAGGRPLPGKSGDVGELEGNFSEFMTARPAGPGETGITAQQAKALGLDISAAVEAPANRRAMAPPPPSRGSVPTELPPGYGREKPLEDTDYELPGGERVRVSATAPTVLERDSKAGTVRPPRGRRPTRSKIDIPALRNRMGLTSSLVSDEDVLQAAFEQGLIPEVPPPVQEPRYVLVPRELDARELETSIRAFDERGNVASRVEQRKSRAVDAQGVSAVMRSLRSQFQPNDVAPQDLEATISTGKKVRGYPAMKQRQFEERTALENRFRSVGLSPDLERLSAENPDQFRAVRDTIKRGDEALQALGVDDPEMAQQLRLVAAHLALDRLEGQTPHGSMIAGEQGPRGFASVPLRGLRLAADPVARGLAGTGMPEAKQRALAASRAGRLAPRADPETLNRFLAMIGLGGSEEDQQ